MKRIKEKHQKKITIIAIITGILWLLHIYLHNIQQNRNKKRKLRSNKNTIHRKCTNCGKSRKKKTKQ